MKNFWKMLAAMMIIALPFALAASSSKDDEEEKGPKTYEFTWEYRDYIDQSAQDLSIYSNATTAISQALASELNKLGYKAQASTKSFTITTETLTDESMRKQISSAITLTTVSAGQSCQVLKKGAKLVVKRGGSDFVTETINN